MEILRKAPDNYKRLYRSIRRKASKCKIKLRFGLASVVSITDDDLEGTGGYFLGVNRELAVACDVTIKGFIKCFVHESCHMDQHFDKRLREKNKQWEEAYILFEKWLYEGKEFSDRKVDKAVQLIMECEKDCEMRSVAKLRRYKLNECADDEYCINIETYIQQANAYLYCYILMREMRVWINATEYPDVYQKCPKTFRDEYKDVPEHFREAVEHRLLNKQLTA